MPTYIPNHNASRSASSKPKAEPKIIHQTFFKSVGPRTYAAQVKEIANGNQLLVLTEGKRDEKSNELRKTRLFIYGEDFAEFFKMLDSVRGFVDAHPVSKATQARRQKYWEKQRQSTPPDSKGSSDPSASAEGSEEADNLDS